MTAAAATAAAALSGPQAGAAPKDERADAQTRVHELYAAAERATEKYNGARERTEKLREKAEQLQERAARGQQRVNGMRTALGEMAGAQYRAGGIDPSVSLFLSRDPEAYLTKAATIERISALQSGRLEKFARALSGLERQRVSATDTLEKLERSQRALNESRRLVKSKLAAAQRLLAATPRAARDADRDSGLGGTVSAAFKSLAPGSGRAALAVNAARRAVGTPYVWGHAGPGGFDCSGLTQWAYKEAGVAIPRTSQAQRTAGRQVPLGAARPGDLVVYRDDASHVGMYVGNGQVVHSPYPGARVRYDPVGMMPIASVTRP
nr:C40 family peptidase [Streptomyces coryli]